MNLIKKKNGISFIVLIVAIVVTLILASIVIIRSNDSRENARKTSYISTLRNVEDTVKQYYLLNEKFPIYEGATKNSFTANEVLTLNNDINLENEIIANEDSNSFFYLVDTSLLLDLKGLGYGLDYKTANSKDVFLVSSNKNIYYLKGMKINGNNYYSLSFSLSESSKIITQNISSNNYEIESYTSSGRITLVSDNLSNKDENLKVIFQILDGESISVETSSNISNPSYKLGQNIFFVNELLSLDQIEDVKSTGKFKAKILNGERVIEERDIYIASLNYSTTSLNNLSLNNYSVSSNENSNLVSFTISNVNNYSRIKYDYYYTYDFNNINGYSKYFKNITSDSDLAKYIIDNGKSIRSDSSGKYNIELEKNVRDIFVVIEKNDGTLIYTTKQVSNVYASTFSEKNSENTAVVISKVIASEGNNITIQYSLDGNTYSNLNTYNQSLLNSKYINMIPNLDKDYLYIKTSVDNYVFVDKLDVGTNYYTVTFDPNGGTVDQTSKSVKYGEKYGTLPIPTREGYVFKGWNGKNKFNYEKNEYYAASTIKENINGIDLYKRNINYSSSTIWPIFYTNQDNIAFEEEKYYTISFDIWSDRQTSFINDNFYVNQSVSTQHNLSEIKSQKQRMYATFKYVLNTNWSYVLHLYPKTDNTNNLYISNILVEENTISTQYEPFLLNSDVIVTQDRDHTLTAIWEIDNVAPTLSLSKFTYKEGFDGWTFSNNAYVDDKGVLILGEDGNASAATSAFYETNGGRWYPDYEVLTTSTIPGDENIGGAHDTMSYFDENFNSASSNAGNYRNGVAYSLELNKWTSSLIENRYKNMVSGWGGNIKYMKFTMQTGTIYSQPIVKIRNFKLYGEAIPNSFYDIRISSSDDNSIVITKYAKGNKNKDFFRTNGDVVLEDSIRVTENGIYTVYVEDSAGNSTIKTIEINNII